MSEPDDDFFRELERRRTRALVDRDLVLIEQLHAPEYELLTPAGRVLSRERYLAEIAAGPFYAAWRHGPMRVRRSATMAVVRYVAELGFPSGRTLRCWHTDSYELRGDVWQAVWSQATALPAADGER